ncbi:hypothetical protein [Nocardia sp. CDC160]|uniref:hypothetical protein n=1 Tax=Nocardia sp. CDC160 TaxID=3112166 RepID=UPI002DBE7E94|nr:hypothetical protein [Nocardia sp. CDC160]
MVGIVIGTEQECTVTIAKPTKAATPTPAAFHCQRRSWWAPTLSDSTSASFPTTSIALTILPDDVAGSGSEIGAPQWEQRESAPLFRCEQYLQTKAGTVNVR